jgi:hypothetical protein
MSRDPWLIVLTAREAQIPETRKCAREETKERLLNIT